MQSNQNESQNAEVPKPQEQTDQNQPEVQPAAKDQEMQDNKVSTAVEEGQAEGKDANQEVPAPQTEAVANPVAQAEIPVAQEEPKVEEPQQTEAIAAEVTAVQQPLQQPESSLPAPVVNQEATEQNQEDQPAQPSILSQSQPKPQQSYGGKGLFGQISQAPQKDELITINLDTYQAARLNSILSQISLNSSKMFRIDPFEKVEGEIKKKEAFEKKENQRLQKEQKRLQQQRQKEEEKQRLREQNRLQMEQHSLKFKQAQKMAMMMGNQEYRNAQLNNVNGGEVNQQLLVSSQVTPAKIAPQENSEMNGEKIDGAAGSIAVDPEANGEAVSFKQNLDIDMKLENLGEPQVPQDGDMKDGVQFNANDPRGLSPMTRRSDRARVDISYRDLNSGKPATDEVDLSGLGQLGGIALNPIGQSKEMQKSRSKVSAGSDVQLAKKNSSAETQKKVEDVLERLKRSTNAHLFNKPIGKQEPLYEKYKSSCKTLSFIELNLKMGNYTNTNSICQDIRMTVACRMDIANVSGDQDQNLQIQEFLMEFDQFFTGLDNLPLGKQADNLNGSTKANTGGSKAKGAQNSKQASQVVSQSAQAQKSSAQKLVKPAENSLQASQAKPVPGAAPIQASVSIEMREPPMSAEEVSQLKMKIDSQLTPDQKKGILPIIKEEALLQQQEHQAKGVTQQNGSTTFEFQLDKLTTKTARKLEKYVNDQVAANKKKQKRKVTDAIRRKKAQAAKKEQQDREALLNAQKIVDPIAGINNTVNPAAAGKNIMLQQNQAQLQMANQATIYQQLYPSLTPQQIQNLVLTANQVKGQAANNPQLQAQLSIGAGLVGNNIQTAQQQALFNQLLQQPQGANQAQMQAGNLAGQIQGGNLAGQGVDDNMARQIQGQAQAQDSSRSSSSSDE